MANPVVVLGGGIGGLSCAYYLSKMAGKQLAGRKIIVLERSKHIGGWIRTIRFDDGVRHETGPHTVRPNGFVGANTLDMVQDLALAPKVIPLKADPKTAQRFIYANNQLNPMPSHLLHLFMKRKPFEQRLYKYIKKELTTPAVALGYGQDISVYNFLRLRLGEDIAKYAGDAFCRGISAGDSKRISFPALFPKPFQLERNFGTIIGGLMKAAKLPSERPDIGGDLSILSKKEKWVSWTLQDGLQTFPERLCDYLASVPDGQVEIYNESEVTSLTPQDNGALKIQVKTTEDTIELESDLVFSALPADVLANVLPSGQLNTVKQSLKEMESVDVAVINLEYKGKVLGSNEGFGFLVPSCENCPLLGVIFASSAIPDLNGGQDVTRLTAMMGGDWFRELFGSPDKVSKTSLLDTAVTNVGKILNLKDDPTRHVVSINRSCIPQYRLGHQDRVIKIREGIQASKLPLHLIGSAFDGIAVNDVIYNSRLAVENYIGYKPPTGLEKPEGEKE